jgi:hypothetical protein
MKLQIKVGADGVIEDAKFKTYGCGSAIASSSLVTEWVKGKTLDEALDQEHADRRRTGAAAGEDPLLDPGRRRHQGGRGRLQEAPRHQGRRSGSSLSGNERLVKEPGARWPRTAARTSWQLH